VPERERIAVLGTAEWDHPIATNQHFVVTQLSREFDVTYVQSLGLRRPRLSGADLARAAQRLRGGRRDGFRRPRPRSLTVLSPRAVPWHSGLGSRLNSALLHSPGGTWARVRPFDLLWTFSPVTYGLAGDAPVIYHCVDLLAEVPGIDRRAVAEGERRLAGAGAPAIATSQVVADHLRGRGFVDLRIWQSTAHVGPFLEAGVRPAASRNAAALYAGSIRADKVDVSLLVALAESGVEVHLAGPLSEGGADGRAALARVTAAGGVYHGTLGAEELAQLASQCTVGLIPYALNAYTRGVSPLKTYEYLAAGLAVVSTALPGVGAVPGHVWREGSVAGFVARVRAALRLTDSDRTARRALAAQETWDERLPEILAVARAEIARRPARVAP
jgi:teichuronic acid biosynthesis glycosyltransferase TuaH